MTAIADETWMPQPLDEQQQKRHDDIVHLALRLAHTGIRVVLPPARRTR